MLNKLIQRQACRFFICGTILYFVISFSSAFATDPWKFGLTYESEKLTDRMLFMFTAVDMNGNGTKEIVAADFIKLGSGRPLGHPFHTPLRKFMVLEWNGKELIKKWGKQWDLDTVQGPPKIFLKYYYAGESKRMMSWKVGDRTIIETIPPYLGFEWTKEGYVLHEQQGSLTEGPIVGSWAFPWLSPSCDEAFIRKEYPRECITGIRDFSGNNHPLIISILQENMDGNVKRTIRLRDMAKGNSILFETEDTNNLYYEGLKEDKYNIESSQGLLFTQLKTFRLFLMTSNNNGNDIQLNPLPESARMSLTSFDLPDVRLGSTKSKKEFEYWGYWRKEFPIEAGTDYIILLRVNTYNKDHNTLTSEDIDFDYKENNLGVGYFDIKDIDGDGLDEIILVEETGKKIWDGVETSHYEGVQDFIRILKWNGKKYEIMWTSPPYSNRGTRFLFDDIKGTGKNQLVVMSPEGTIQIWEMK